MSGSGFVVATVGGVVLDVGFLGTRVLARRMVVSEDESSELRMSNIAEPGGSTLSPEL